MKNLLIVDPDRSAVDHIGNTLAKRHASSLQVHKATSGKEAVRIIRSVRMDVVLTALRLPEVDGFQLLTWINSRHPDIRVIIMAERSSPLASGRLEQLDSDQVIEKPVDVGLLVNRLFTDVQESFGGEIRGISLSSFLQMMELEGKTCTLDIASGERKGSLFILDGEVIAARLGDRRGTPAALEILCWKKTAIQLAHARKEIKREIDVPLMNLLLESRRLRDERQMPARKTGKAERRHERVNRLVSIDWDLDEWSYRNVVRDISMSGAFIETDHPVQQGDEVLLTLAVGDPQQACRIRATVVRRDERGIGVVFEDLSLSQRQVVEIIVKGKNG